MCLGETVVTLSLGVDRAQALPGDIIEYTIRVSNEHTVDLVDVKLADRLPPQVEFVNATSTQGTPTFDSSTQAVTLDIGTLTPGQVVTLVVRVRVRAQARPGDPISNAVRVCEHTGCCRDVSSTIAVVPAGIPVTGIGPGPREVATLWAVGLSVVALGLIIIGAVILRASSRERWGP